MKTLLLAIGICCATMSVALASDSGPKADVAAVRAAATRPGITVDNVRVVGNYAALEWIQPPAGGMSVYKRTSGHRWKLLLSEGGVVTASELIKKGVPAATAHKLQPNAP